MQILSTELLAPFRLATARRRPAVTKGVTFVLYAVLITVGMNYRPTLILKVQAAFPYKTSALVYQAVRGQSSLYIQCSENVRS
jgi:hypothetical protein